MATVKSYDPRCYDLAAIFLGDEPSIHNEANIHALALEIQQTIEDEIEFMLRPEDFEVTVMLGDVGNAGGGS